MEPKASFKSKKVRAWQVFLLRRAWARVSCRQLIMFDEVHIDVTTYRCLWTEVSMYLFVDMWSRFRPETIWWKSLPTTDVSAIVRKFLASNVLFLMLYQCHVALLPVFLGGGDGDSWRSLKYRVARKWWVQGRCLRTPYVSLSAPGTDMDFFLLRSNLRSLCLMGDMLKDMGSARGTRCRNQFNFAWPNTGAVEYFSG